MGFYTDHQEDLLQNPHPPPPSLQPPPPNRRGHPPPPPIHSYIHCNPIPAQVGYDKYEFSSKGEWYSEKNSQRIRIRILFGLRKSAEYEYEYYSVLKNHPNTNTNTIRFENIYRIRIRILVFGPNYSNNIRIPNYSLTSDVIRVN